MSLKVPIIEAKKGSVVTIMDESGLTGNKYKVTHLMDPAVYIIRLNSFLIGDSHPHLIAIFVAKSDVGGKYIVCIQFDEGQSGMVQTLKLRKNLDLERNVLPLGWNARETVLGVFEVEECLVEDLHGRPVEYQDTASTICYVRLQVDLNYYIATTTTIESNKIHVPIGIGVQLMLQLLRLLNNLHSKNMAHGSLHSSSVCISMSKDHDPVVHLSWFVTAPTRISAASSSVVLDTQHVDVVAAIDLWNKHFCHCNVPDEVVTNFELALVEDATLLASRRTAGQWEAFLQQFSPTSDIQRVAPTACTTISASFDQNNVLMNMKGLVDNENRISDEKRINDEKKRVAEEKQRVADEKRITDEKRMADEKRVADEKRITNEKRITDEKQQIANEKREADVKHRVADRKLVAAAMHVDPMCQIGTNPSLFEVQLSRLLSSPSCSALRGSQKNKGHFTPETLLKEVDRVMNNPTPANSGKISPKKNVKSFTEFDAIEIFRQFVCLLQLEEMISSTVAQHLFLEHDPRGEVDVVQDKQLDQVWERAGRSTARIPSPWRLVLGSTTQPLPLQNVSSSLTELMGQWICGQLGTLVDATNACKYMNNSDVAFIRNTKRAVLLKESRGAADCLGLCQKSITTESESVPVIVALRRLHGGIDEQRLRQLIRLSSTALHVNRCYDVTTDQGTYQYLIMDPYHCLLPTFLQHDVNLREADLQPFVHDIAVGLQELHREKEILNGVLPNNVCVGPMVQLNRPGQPNTCTWPSRFMLLHTSALNPPMSTSWVTVGDPSTSTGTPLLCNDDPYTQESDVYCFGVLLIRMLCHPMGLVPPVKITVESVTEFAGSSVEWRDLLLGMLCRDVATRWSIQMVLECDWLFHNWVTGWSVVTLLLEDGTFLRVRMGSVISSAETLEAAVWHATHDSPNSNMNPNDSHFVVKQYHTTTRHFDAIDLGPIKISTNPLTNVAVKVEREFHLATKLRGHRRLVQYLGYNSRCVGMLPAGTSLRFLLKGGEKKYVPGKHEVWEWSFSVLVGILFLHHSSLVHRDVKLSNVMILGEQVVSGHGLFRFRGVSLGDFGFLCPINSMGGRKGTTDYMAPEVANGVNVVYGSRTDLFAFGTLMGKLMPESSRKPPWSCALHLQLSLTQGKPEDRITGDAAACHPFFLLPLLERVYLFARNTTSSVLQWSQQKSKKRGPTTLGLDFIEPIHGDLLTVIAYYFVVPWRNFLLAWSGDATKEFRKVALQAVPPLDTATSPPSAGDDVQFFDVAQLSEEFSYLWKTMCTLGVPEQCDEFATIESVQTFLLHLPLHKFSEMFPVFVRDDNGQHNCEQRAADVMLLPATSNGNRNNSNSKHQLLRRVCTCTSNYSSSSTKQQNPFHLSSWCTTYPTIANITCFMDLMVHSLRFSSNTVHYLVHADMEQPNHELDPRRNPNPLRQWYDEDVPTMAAALAEFREELLLCCQISRRDVVV